MPAEDERGNSVATVDRDRVLRVIYGRGDLEDLTRDMDLKGLRKIHDILFDESIRISKEAEGESFNLGKLKARIDNTFEHHSREMCPVNIAYCTRNSCDDYDPECVSRKIKDQLRRMRDIILEKAALVPQAVKEFAPEVSPEEEVTWVQELSESGIIEELIGDLRTVPGVRRNIVIMDDGRVLGAEGESGDGEELVSASLELWRENSSYMDRMGLGVFSRALIEFGKLRILLVGLSRLAVIVLMDEDASLGLVELFVDRALGSIEVDILKAKET